VQNKSVFQQPHEASADSLTRPAAVADIELPRKEGLAYNTDGRRILDLRISA